jgi:hypothetical protein
MQHRNSDNNSRQINRHLPLRILLPAVQLTYFFPGVFGFFLKVYRKGSDLPNLPVQNMRELSSTHCFPSYKSHRLHPMVLLRPQLSIKRSKQVRNTMADGSRLITRKALAPMTRGGQAERNKLTMGLAILETLRHLYYCSVD